MDRWMRLAKEFAEVGAPGLSRLCARCAEAKWPVDLQVMCTPVSLLLTQGRVVPAGRALTFAEQPDGVTVARHEDWMQAAIDAPVAIVDGPEGLASLLGWLRPS